MFFAKIKKFVATFAHVIPQWLNVDDEDIKVNNSSMPAPHSN